MFETYYQSYKDEINTIAATYATNVKKDLFYTRARNFGTCLERALFGDNVPVAVYEKLLETVHQNLPILHRYMELRKKILGVEELHMYDIYTPLVSEVEGQLFL